MDVPEIQTAIYSHLSNKCKYINEVDLKYKLIFDKVLDDLINVNNLIKHKDIMIYSSNKLMLTKMINKTKLKRYFASLIFSELLDSVEDLDINVIKTFYTLRLLLGLDFIHFNEINSREYITFHK